MAEDAKMTNESLKTDGKPEESKRSAKELDVNPEASTRTRHRQSSQKENSQTST